MDRGGNTLTFPTVQLVLRPGIIDLGWGHPSPTLLPVELIRQATQAMLDRLGAQALAYGADPGAGPLLAWLCEHIARSEGRAPAPNEIAITGGISDGLQQLCTMWTSPGDVVLVESPTYHLAVRILRDHPLELVPVPADMAGLRVDALADTLAQLQSEGRRPRMLYLVPTFHNPTGACLAPERRNALIELAAANDLLIIEDDVYRELAYDVAAPPSLWSMAPPGVVARMGSFAKSVAPGLRLGWVTASAPLVQRLVGSGLRDSGGGANHFSALVAAEFCAAGFFERNLAHLRAAYQARRDALLAGLAAHLPDGCQVHAPGGGFFIWVTLPEGRDTRALLLQAEAAGVAYLPGARFHLDSRGTNALRLSFSLYEPEELSEAARRLGQALSAA